MISSKPTAALLLLRCFCMLFVLLVPLACVLAPPPPLGGVLCESDEDCNYGMRCCSRANSPTKICHAGCKDCIPGDTRACYEASKNAFRGKGLCKEGKQSCKADGTWDTACQGAVLPAREICDGQDNDCDGKTDEELGTCECTDVGATRACFSGDPKLESVGPCKAGKQTCLASHKWGPCDGEVPPKAEECNGKDDDCDGKVDQELKKTCKGDCGEGEILCVGGKWGECSAQSSPEECNGKDDDCDGNIDNVKGAQTPLTKNCYSGPAGTKDVGECKGGKQTCTSGKWTSCLDEVTPKPKDCNNNKDNNCDGQTDTNCTCPDPCKQDLDCQVATCANRIFCISGKCSNQCTNGCLTDDDCDVPACGSRNECINGICSLRTCPTTCRSNFECQVTACGGKTLCNNGKCSPAPCPSVCVTSADCNPASCSERTTCFKGKCVLPCEALTNFGKICEKGVGVCKGQGKQQCAPDGKTLVCDAKEDLSKKQAKDICTNQLDDNCDGFLNDNCGITNTTWALQVAGTSFDDVTDIAVDDGGNVYITGSYTGSALFGTHNLLPYGAKDIYVAKIDPSGKYLWAKRAGGTLDDTGRGIAVDKNGNVFITGSFRSTSVTFEGVLMSTKGVEDIFYAKYDPNGKVLWAKSSGSTGVDAGEKVAVDSSGNAYFTGFFNGTININGQTFTSAGLEDVFITKIDPSGAFQWSRIAGSTGSDKGYGISVDSQDRLFVGGTAKDNFSLANQTLTRAYGGFFTRMNTSNGNVDWLLNGGLYTTADSQGNMYGTARVGGVFNYGVSRVVSKDSSPGGDALLIRATADGKAGWAILAGGTSSDIGLDIATDKSGNAYWVGYFRSPTVENGPTKLTLAGTEDSFVFKVDPTGKILWGTSVGSTARTTRASAVAVDKNGHIYAAGIFSGTTKFGTHSLTARGSYDGFIWKILAPPNTPPPPPVP